MQNTTNNVISQGFDGNEATRIELVNPRLVINAHRLRGANFPVLLSEVWLHIKTETNLTREQIESALRLIPKSSKVDRAAKTTFSATRRIETLVPFEEFTDGYLTDSENLQSINDRPPTTNINDDIIDGPVELPSHAWSRYFASFEKYDKDHPEFGMLWHSVVLYRDGISLRIAAAANFMHALLPKTAEMLEGVEFEDDAQAQTTIHQLIELDDDAKSMKSLGDILKRLSKTSEPYISPADLNQMGEYASDVLGVDISTLEYSTN